MTSERDYKILYKEARGVAWVAHQGQIYDIFPYTKHLDDVVNVLIEFGYEGDYLIAGWLHDSTEDGNLTYHKIKKAFGLNVAEMVFACSDGDGRYRREKKAAVFKKIKLYPESLPVKLADRIANTRHGLRMSSEEKLVMYFKEYPVFKKRLFVKGQVDNMWKELDQLIDELEKRAEKKRIQWKNSEK